MSIVDKYNEIGNSFAISSKSVGDALLRSASSLATANNTLEESIGLVVGANASVQDAEKVGTALRTTSMRIRGAKTELEELGESTDGMAESTSKLRGELKALTGVDIMKSNSEFKSTFEIFKELSEVFDSLPDISKANVLELVAGKNNSNVVASLLTNFADAQAAMETALNDSDLSAVIENEKYLDSIQGKLDQTSASFQALSSTIVNSELVKLLLDIANGLLQFANSADGMPATVIAVTTAVTGLAVALKGINSSSLGGNIKGFFSDIGRPKILGFHSLRKLPHPSYSIVFVMPVQMDVLRCR